MCVRACVYACMIHFVTFVHSYRTIEHMGEFVIKRLILEMRLTVRAIRSPASSVALFGSAVKNAYCVCVLEKHFDLICL